MPRHGTGVDAVDAAPLRPAASRLDERRDERVGSLAAAAAGQAQALGPGGVLSLQRAVGNAATAALLEGDGFGGVPTGGSPLGDGVRAVMEQRFGASFDDVRVHTGAEAHASAQSVEAQAYTSGQDIVFANGTYDPSSAAGQTMLAHELTHVVQQRSGPVDGSDHGGVSVSDPSDRFEREAVANADHVMSGAPAAAPAPSVQRVEEETVQTFVQRSAEHDHEHDELREADQ